jgi:predicted dithiol-disulfide oxidoreductase (DUF899 family)
MPTLPTAHPDIATREDWLASRKKLLAREREVTHLRDAVNAERRRLPMVKVEKDYVFEGPAGEVRLRDMFEGRPQLYIHHFMWIDAIDEGCPSCTAAADMTFTQKDRGLLNARGVTFACVSRAPFASIARYRDQHSWTFPWYSSRDNDFSYDYHVTMDPPGRRSSTTTSRSTSCTPTGGATTTCAATFRVRACSCAAAMTSSTPTLPMRAGWTIRRLDIRSST